MTTLSLNLVPCKSFRWSRCWRRTTFLVRSQHAATHSGASRPSAADAQALRQPPQHSPFSLLVSRRIAAARAAESRRCRDCSGETPLLFDPYAELLADWQDEKRNDEKQQPGLEDAVAGKVRTALDVISTLHLDHLLLNAIAVSSVNRITPGDYRQVVLLGDAMDTRPYRLPVTPGTSIFLVAPMATHSTAAAAMSSEQAVAIAEGLVTVVEQEEPSTSTTSSTGGTTTGAAAQVEGTPEARVPSSRGLIAPVAVDAASSANATGISVAEAAGNNSPVSEGPEEGSVEPGTTGRSSSSGPIGRSRRQALRGPRPAAGCLLRRVPLELRPGADFSSLLPALESAGFRADRLSVWVLQGLSGLGLSYRDVVSVLAEVAHCAAYHSLLLGELPPMSYSQAANALADCGLLGAPMAFGTVDSSYGRWRHEWSPAVVAAADSGTVSAALTAAALADGGVDVAAADGGIAVVDMSSLPQRWLFAAQQIRLSATQMETYEVHRAAAEETDEDFFDNFS